MATSVIIAGTTPRFRLAATKDGAVWDLTGATVTLLLRTPSGEVLTRAATLLVAASGTAYYDALTTDVEDAGQWSRCWRVVQGSVDVRSRARRFAVEASP